MEKGAAAVELAVLVLGPHGERERARERMGEDNVGEVASAFWSSATRPDERNSEMATNQ
jgi:hypothetical protein